MSSLVPLTNRPGRPAAELDGSSALPPAISGPSIVAVADRARPRSPETAHLGPVGSAAREHRVEDTPRQAAHTARRQSAAGVTPRGDAANDDHVVPRARGGCDESSCIVPRRDARGLRLRQRRRGCPLLWRRAVRWRRDMRDMSGRLRRVQRDVWTDELRGVLRRGDLPAGRGGRRMRNRRGDVRRMRCGTELQRRRLRDRSCVAMESRGRLR